LKPHHSFVYTLYITFRLTSYAYCVTVKLHESTCWIKISFWNSIT